MTEIQARLADLTENFPLTSKPVWQEAKRALGENLSFFAIESSPVTFDADSRSFSGRARILAEIVQVENKDRNESVTIGASVSGVISDGGSAKITEFTLDELPV